MSDQGLVASLDPRHSSLRHLKRFRPYLLAALPATVLAMTWVGASWLAGRWGDHNVSHYVRSPNGRYVAHFMYLGQNETPPYGPAVRAASAWNPLGELTGTYLFKGGCGRESLDWEGDRQLVLTCSPGGTVVSLISPHGDIVFRRVERNR